MGKFEGQKCTFLYFSITKSEKKGDFFHFGCHGNKHHQMSKMILFMVYGSQKTQSDQISRKSERCHFQALCKFFDAYRDYS